MTYPGQHEDEWERLAAVVGGSDVENLTAARGTEALSAVFSYAAEGSDLKEAFEHTLRHFHGHYPNLGAWAYARWAGKVADALEAWAEAKDEPWPLEEIEDMIDWEEWGERAYPDRVYTITVDSGLYCWGVPG